MPGLTLISTSDPESAPTLMRAAFAPTSQDRYVGTRLWSGDSLYLVATTYPGYPLQTFETAKYRMCLEGGLYGTPSSRLSSVLQTWATAILGPGDDSLPRTLLRTDGDFIAVFRRKSTTDWAVVTDVMGRLPLYAHTTSSRTCLTRDFHLFNRLSAGPAPDRLGAAQQLTFGYPLGNRTLRQGVERLPPGTVLRPGSSPTTIRQHRIIDYNFDTPRRHADRSITENARELVARLDEDARARCQWKSGPSVLALSGGLDSRSIACSLSRTNCSFEATTFARPKGRNASDVEYARKIAACFALSHDVISLPPRSPRHLRDLLRAKGGLNPFDVSYMIPYLETLSKRYVDGAHLLTGNGGALLRDLQPTQPIANHDKLLQALFEKAWLNPERAARLVGVRPERLLSSIRERLATYPECSLRGQYIHFAFERLFKYSFEGEDRNRSYLWSSAPYHGLHFTQYALHCPYTQKESYRLYRAFLRALSERTLRIGYSNFYGLRMTSIQYNLYRSLRWIVRQLPALRNYLNRHRGRFRSYSSQSEVPTLIREHLNTTDCPPISEERATQLANHPDRAPARALDNVLTIMLALCPSSILEHHAR